MKHPIGTKARTGEKCPESGIWRPDTGGDTAPIAKGNVMPPSKGQAAVWTLIQYA